MIAVYGLAGLFVGWLAVMCYRVWRLAMACRAAGGCGAQGLAVREAAGGVGEGIGIGSRAEGLQHLAVLVQDQADGVEGLVHRLAAVLSGRPGLLVTLVDGGSADETALIVARLARRYNLEFFQLDGDGPAMDSWPGRCLDLRGLAGRDLWRFDWSGLT